MNIQPPFNFGTLVPSMRIFLVRHGETDWNLEKKAQGHTDIPLNERGVRQAVAVAHHLRNLGRFNVLSSDLIRASETARIIANQLGTQHQESPHLREQGFGIFEGKPYAEVGQELDSLSQKLQLPRHEVQPTDGESAKMVWNRIQPVIDSLCSDTIIVCHGGTLGLALAKLLGGDFSLARSFWFSNACINELERQQNGVVKLIRYNDVAHLKGIE